MQKFHYYLFPVLVFILSLLPGTLHCQSAFVQLPDATGYADQLQTHHLDSLHAAAQRLTDALPAEFQSQFAVYDMGFYSHHTSYEGGIPDVMQQAIDGLATSYYLVFGREINSDGELERVWVEMELPEGGYFSCINSTMPTVLNELLTKSRLNLYPNSSNGINIINYAEAFSHEISHFKDELNYFKSCCPTSSCNPCVYSDLDIFQLLIERNVLTSPIRIVNDPDFGQPPIALGPGDPSSRSSITLNVKVGFLEDTTEVEADDYISQFLSDDVAWIYEKTAESITPSVHLFKYPRDCNLFESKWDSYLNDVSDYKYFFTIINVDDDFGVFGFHFDSGVQGSRFVPKEENILRGMGYQGDYPYEDEIIGIQEVLDSTNASCFDVLSGSLAVGGWSDEMYSSDYQHTPGYKEVVDYHLEKASKDLREAKYQLDIYRVKEYEAIKLAMGYDDCWWFQACGSRAWMRASVNVCRQEIHTTFDICGFVFPVCDLANLVLYLESGDLKNATFSAIGTMPIAGQAAVGIKYAAKSVKLGDKAAILKFSVERSGHVHWVGGRDKLRNVIKRLRIQHTFDGIQLTYNSAIHNAHHLIPWSLVDKATTKHMYLMQRLARLEWHPSHPYKNGLIIPKNLPNGNTFHGSHASYNRWVDDALSEINKVQDSQLISKMDELSNILKLEIEKAYQANRSIHRHFDDIILMPRYKDLIK